MIWKKHSVPGGHLSKQPPQTLAAESQDKIARWLGGTLTPQESKEFDEQAYADKAFGRQFVRFLVAEYRKKDAAARAERPAAATAPGLEDCTCELVPSESVSDRAILFTKYLGDDATPEEVEVLMAELKADPAFREEAAQMTITEVLLRKIHKKRGGWIKALSDAFHTRFFGCNGRPSSG